MVCGCKGGGFVIRRSSRAVSDWHPVAPCGTRSASQSGTRRRHVSVICGPVQRCAKVSDRHTPSIADKPHHHYASRPANPQLPLFSTVPALCRRNHHRLQWQRIAVQNPTSSTWFNFETRLSMVDRVSAMGFLFAKRRRCA